MLHRQKHRCDHRTDHRTVILLFIMRTRVTRGSDTRGKRETKEALKISLLASTHLRLREEKRGPEERVEGGRRGDGRG